MFQTMVVATDGSPTATETVEVALRVAALLGASVHLLIVTDDEAAANAALGTAAEWASEFGVMSTPRRVSGDAGQRILEVAEQVGADLVVVGDRGMHGDDRLSAESVPNHVVQHASCSVLLVDSTRRVAGGAA